MKYLTSLIFSLISLALVLYGPALLADVVYKAVDANGKVIYSDQPLENGKQIDVTPAPSYTPPPLPKTSSVPTQPMEPPTHEVKNYQISIVQPQNHETFSTAIDTIDVKLALTPALQPNDQVRILLNDQQYGQLYSSPDIQLRQLSRGAYQLQAQVIGGLDQSVKGKSDAITFYQQRAMVRP